MGPHDRWGLPYSSAGPFHPSQVAEGWPPAPGYSCRHCGTLTVQRRWLRVHAWNKSIFCGWRHRDFHLAAVMQ